MRWYGHVMRRDEEYAGKTVMGIEVQGSRRSGRPKKRWADCVKDDLREKGLSGEEVYDRATWKRLSSHIDPTLKTLHNYSLFRQDDSLRPKSRSLSVAGYNVISSFNWLKMQHIIYIVTSPWMTYLGPLWVPCVGKSRRQWDWFECHHYQVPGTSNNGK